MNEMRKLMEMVESGEYGSVPTTDNDIEIDGVGVMFYDDQVMVYDEGGEFQVFMPLTTWQAFIEASKKHYGGDNK